MRKRWYPVALLLLLAGGLLPRSLPAQGFVRWEYQRYLYYPGYDYYSSGLTAGTTDKVGAATARTYWSLMSDKYRGTALNRFELHLDDVRVAGRTWNIGVGDLRSPESSGFTGSAAVRGISFSGALSPRLSVTTSVGRAADIYARGSAPAFTVNDVYLSQQLRATPRKWLTLSHWLTYRHDRRQTVSVYSRPSAASLVVFSNHAESQVLPFLNSRNYLSLSRAGFADRAPAAGANISSQWDLNLARYLANLAYQYKGSDYIGPSNEGRTVGYHLLSLSHSYAPIPLVGLNAGYSQQWSLTAADSTGYANNSLSWYTGFQLNPAPWPVVTYRLERYTADNTFVNSTYHPRQWQHTIRLSCQLRSYYLQAEYRFQREQGRTGGAGTNAINQFGCDASRRWNDWQATYSQQLQRQTYRDQLLWDQALRGELRWQKYYSTRLELRWSQIKADGVRWGTDHWSWELTQGATWASGWDLATTVRQQRYFPGTITSSFRSLQWTLALGKRFDRVRDAVDLGIAYGRVYEDNNGNGRQDPGETGVEKVPVLLDRIKKTVTDEDGVYHLSGITPGRHTITVDSRYLSASLDPTDRSGKSFRSFGVWGPKIDFPVSPLNKITGTVFADINRNGVQDPDEPGLPGAFVLMGEQRAFTGSGEDGTFRFFNVRPGRYQVFMDPKFLPDTLQFSGPGSYTVDVEDLKKVPPLSFGIAKRVRPVRRIVFGPSVAVPPAEIVPVTKPSAKPVTKPVAKPKPAAQPRPRTPASPAEIKRLRELGIRQYASGDYAKALQTWQQLLKLDPSNAEAKSNLQRTKAKLDAQNKARN